MMYVTCTRNHQHIPWRSGSRATTTQCSTDHSSFVIVRPENLVVIPKWSWWMFLISLGLPVIFRYDKDIRYDFLMFVSWNTQMKLFWAVESQGFQQRQKGWRYAALLTSMAAGDGTSHGLTLDFLDDTGIIVNFVTGILWNSIKRRVDPIRT